MEAKTQRTILTITLGLLLIVVFVFIVIFIANSKTYVRIVDTSDDRALEGLAPGADIDAIAIEKWKNNERTKAVFAGTVINESAQIAESGEAYSNSESALGNPESDEQTAFVSLNGGELIVSIPKRLNRGDTLSVYEIGAVNAVRSDSYDVYTSKKSDGPWELRGSGNGPLSVVIE